MVSLRVLVSLVLFIDEMIVILNRKMCMVNKCLKPKSRTNTTGISHAPLLTQRNALSAIELTNVSWASLYYEQKCQISNGVDLLLLRDGVTKKYFKITSKVQRMKRTSERSRLV